ncbi:transposase family protein [Arachnia propionica]|uniref:transposase family protein n=1 Tax=Arachnia propionica TaxID=1750 RepID=UPI0030CFCA7A
MIHTSQSGNLPVAGSRVLGLFRCIQVTVLTLRHNLTQELLADIHTVSQSTISRVITVYTPLIAEALQAWVPGTGDLDPDRQYIIDGTLAPCWSWSKRPELYSGKHHTTGVNLQVACTLTGHLAWISPPLPGSVHDAKAIKESGFLETLDATTHIGDKEPYSQPSSSAPWLVALLADTPSVNKPQGLHRIGNDHPRPETRPW